MHTIGMEEKVGVFAVYKYNTTNVQFEYVLRRGRYYRSNIILRDNICRFYSMDKIRIHKKRRSLQPDFITDHSLCMGLTTKRQKESQAMLFYWEYTVYLL